MFRKIFSTVVVLLLFVGGSAPARAADQNLVQKSVINPTKYKNAGAALANVGKNEHVAIWMQENSPTELTLQTAAINSSGTLSPAKQLFSIDSAFMANPRFSWATNSKGQLAVSMAVVTKNADVYTSNIYVWFSNDGSNWSSPIRPLPEYRASEGCDQLSGGCGYTQAELAFGSKDLLALVFAKVLPGGGNQVLATTSNDGVTWANVTVLDEKALSTAWMMSPNQISLVRVGDSIVVQFPTYIAGAWSIASSSIDDQRLPSWSAVNYRESEVTLGETRNAVTSAGDLASFTWVYGQSGVSLHYTLWNAQTRTWSSIQNLYTCNCQYIEASDSPVASSGTKTSIIWAEISQGTPPIMKMLTIEAGKSPVVSTLKESAAQGQNIWVVENAYAKDGTQNVLFVSAVDSATLMAKVVGGALSGATAIPQASAWVYSVDFAMDMKANISILYVTQDPVADVFNLAYLEQRRESAPVAKGVLKVSGTPKVKAKLTASGLDFTSISGVSTTGYQWFACTKKVSSAPKALPSTCKAIKGATKATYTLAKADTGRFLLVAVSSANEVAKVTKYSQATGPVK